MQFLAHGALFYTISCMQVYDWASPVCHIHLSCAELAMSLNKVLMIICKQEQTAYIIVRRRLGTVLFSARHLANFSGVSVCIYRKKETWWFLISNNQPNCKMTGNVRHLVFPTSINSLKVFLQAPGIKCFCVGVKRLHLAAMFWLLLGSWWLNVYVLKVIAVWKWTSSISGV